MLNDTKSLYSELRYQNTSALYVKDLNTSPTKFQQLSPSSASDKVDSSHVVGRSPIHRLLVRASISLRIAGTMLSISTGWRTKAQLTEGEQSSFGNDTCETTATNVEARELSTAKTSARKLCTAVACVPPS